MSNNNKNNHFNYQTDPNPSHIILNILNVFEVSSTDSHLALICVCFMS